MALIDEISTNNKNDQQSNQDFKCISCKSDFANNLNQFSTRIKTCQKCFNNRIDEVLKKIDNNINQLSIEIANIENLLKMAYEEFKKTDDIIFKNKIEIDLLNGNCTIEKYKIDLKNNMYAYFINQRQANDFRSLEKWDLFKIDNKYNITEEDKNEK